MPNEYERTLFDRVDRFRRLQIDCKGRGIERPDIKEPFCNNVASWKITFYRVDQNGKRLGDKEKSRVCTRHLRLLAERGLIELADSPVKRGRQHKK